uniref:IgGFc-binding protein n=1 Tax=Magallana gigas TaxID=29159 RepID=K1PIX3_MAGGI
MPKRAKANIMCQQNQKREGCSFHLQTEYSAGCRKCTNWTCRTKSWLKFLQEEQVFQINKEAESVAGGICNLKCGANAFPKRRGRKCRCKKGYRGNPKTGCTAACVCRASGDPHYKTYDGSKIHFMGVCKYTLTKTTEKTPCAFNIMVSNERRNNKKKVSYTKQVDVEIGGSYVVLFKGRKTEVNGTGIDVSKSRFEKGGILLTTVGRRFVKLKSASCGVTVLWDGKHSVEVTAERSKYGGKLTGICGDCNGKRDDFRLANGTSVSRLKAKDKYREIGDSYRVVDAQNPLSACGPTPAFSSCTKTQTAKYSKTEACGLMSDTSDQNPFGKCVEWMKKSEEPDGINPFSSCLIDACNNDGPALKKIMCSALEEFEEQCVENGYAPPEKNDWRNITSCSLPESQKCQENEEYVEDGSGCPNTCQSPKSEDTCTDVDIAGCQCKKGYVREGDKCVPYSECGCMMQGRYYPQGTSILSKNCNVKMSCKLVGGTPVAVKVGNSCGRGETCKSTKGIGSCRRKVCNLKCGANAFPKRRGRKCRCKKGYRGNPKTGCTAACVCRASGDPHYKTYDGSKIHFMGVCKYTLTKTTEKTPCAFNIMVSNERRNNKKKVSYTKQVDVEIGGSYVVLFKGRKTEVNGTGIDVSKSRFEKGGILLTTVGRRFVKLKSASCGVTVLWDGKHSVEVTAERSKYGGKLTGICGDCNGKRDDFRLANGTSVSRLKAKDKYREIGDSYRVVDAQNPLSACGPTPAFSSCTKTQTAKYSKTEACGLMSDTSDQNPFGKCVEWMKKSEEPDGINPFSSCLIDACNNDGPALKKIMCSALEEFEEQCVENGYAPPEKNDWRNITSCSLPESQKCQENEEYVEDGSGCPNTCQSPKSEDTCTDVDIAGCQCKKGYVREGDKCVPYSECGCMMQGRYYPQGTSILSKNCNVKMSCKLVGGTPVAVKVGNSCGRGETCKSTKGIGSCRRKVCNLKCGANAFPKRRGRKCRCKKGYRGNPKTGCTAACVCRASGDPHYKTYDGSKIHFMGVCKYTLTKTTEKTPCAFNIMVSNERRNNKKKVSYTKQVDVEIGGSYVVLFKGRKTEVNGTGIDVSKSRFEKGGILLTTVGRRFVKLKSASCGVTVLWDGKHSVEVTADKSKYGGKLTGICGDCNGKRDDFRLANGTSVSRLKAKDKYREIGDSYRVVDAQNPLSACGPTPAFSSCTKTQTAKYSKPEACGLMSDTSDQNPFGKCVEWMKKSEEPDGINPFSSCLIDACNNDGPALKKIVCSALEEFEEQCVENGYAPPEKNDWRNITSCSLPESQKCQENEEYVEDGSGCPNTCQSPKSEDTCTDVDIAGCQCKKGYVREGDKCVPYSECGCMMQGRYYPVSKPKVHRLSRKSGCIAIFLHKDT